LRRGPPPSDGKLIAYFSADTVCGVPAGLLGWLGVLSGDHLSPPAIRTIRFIGLGLLYQQGFSGNSSTPTDGSRTLSRERLLYLAAGHGQGRQLRGPKVVVKGGCLPATSTYRCGDWIGRITLYLLDTNIPENVFRRIGASRISLYGGRYRIRASGRKSSGHGGSGRWRRWLKAHRCTTMNEGTPRFSRWKQVRVLMRDPETDLRRSPGTRRAPSNVFTTHTPVPAGIDLFRPGLMYHYFSQYCAEVGVDFHS